MVSFPRDFRIFHILRVTLFVLGISDCGFVLYDCGFKLCIALSRGHEVLGLGTEFGDDTVFLLGNPAFRLDDGRIVPHGGLHDREEVLVDVMEFIHDSFVMLFQRHIQGSHLLCRFSRQI